MSSLVQKSSRTPRVPLNCAVDETKLRFPKKFHHRSHHAQHRSHVQTPTRTLAATTHPQLRIRSLQTQHTTTNGAATDLDVPTHHLISTSPSPATRTPSANPSQSKNQTEALHHQTGVHQTPCQMASGWQAHQRILVPAGSGCLRKDNKAVCSIRLERKSASGSARVADITRTIRIPRARIQVETEIEIEIGRGAARRKPLLHRKSADGRRT